MKTFTLQREQYLSISIEQAWAFFSSAQNLDKITPPGMGFKIVSKINEGPIFSGMQIEYIVKPMLGIPLKWVTEIKDVQSPYLFTDRQLKGPYTFWEHTHKFQTVDGGIKMTDEVKYRLPLGWLGIIAHTVFVKNKLKSIFDFRASTLTKLFGEINKGKYVAG